MNVESKTSRSIVQVLSEGKLLQAIDDTSDKIDSILEKHLTNEQKQSLDGIYKQLDDLFAGDKLSQKQEKAVEELFEQVNQVYDTSIEKLSDDEYETIDKLANKIEGLITQYENNTNTGDKQSNAYYETAGSEGNLEAISGSDSGLSDVAASRKKANKSVTIQRLAICHHFVVESAHLCL